MTHSGTPTRHPHHRIVYGGGAAEMAVPRRLPAFYCDTFSLILFLITPNKRPQFSRIFFDVWIFIMYWWRPPASTPQRPRPLNRGQWGGEGRRRGAPASVGGAAGAEPEHCGGAAVGVPGRGPGARGHPPHPRLQLRRQHHAPYDRAPPGRPLSPPQRKLSGVVWEAHTGFGFPTPGGVFFSPHPRSTFG